MRPSESPPPPPQSSLSAFRLVLSVYIYIYYTTLASDSKQTSIDDTQLPYGNITLLLITFTTLSEIVWGSTLQACDESVLALCWPCVGLVLGLCWPVLALCWLCVGSSWLCVGSVLALCWPVLSLCWLCVGLCWLCVGPVLVLRPHWPRFSEMTTPNSLTEI